MSLRPAFQGSVFPFNPFGFKQFRTLFRNRATATSFSSIISALFLSQRRWGTWFFLPSANSHDSPVSKSFICHTCKKSPVSPILATLPKTASCKSFLCLPAVAGHTCHTPYPRGKRPLGMNFDFRISSFVSGSGGELRTANGDPRLTGHVITAVRRRVPGES